MFRAIKRSFIEGTRGMFKNGLMTVTSLFVVTACIFIFGVFLMITFNINHMTSEMAQSYQVDVYITRPDDADDNVYENIKARIIDDIKKSVMPGGSVRRLTYEEMASEVLNKYRGSEVIYDDVYSKPPHDFVFPEYIDWSRYSFSQNEMGYFALTMPSAADENYFMSIFVDDMMFGDEMREQPVIHYVGFYHN